MKKLHIVAVLLTVVMGGASAFAGQTIEIFAVEPHK
jgi:hypothetical protein